MVGYRNFVEPQRELRVGDNQRGVVCGRGQGQIVSGPDPPLRFYGVKMAGKLVSERVCRFENTSQGGILAAPRKLATCGDFGEKPLKQFHLSADAS